MSRPPRERPHRLPEAAYFGRKSVSFTACELRRNPAFTDASLVTTLVSHLAKAAQQYACIVPVYCFMPDHLHAVIMGREAYSRPKIAMERFKYTSGSWLETSFPNVQWQKDFHDRIVRASDDWANHMRYIALNPVRAGLAEHIWDYSFTGSIGCDLKEILGDAFW